MRAALGLVGIVLVGWFVERFMDPAVAGVEMGTTRAVTDVGVVLLGAWLSGKLAERAQIPAITGYLIFGILIGPQVMGLVEFSMIVPSSAGHVPPLQFVSDLAIALIALTAGSEIQIASLRGKVRSLVVLLAIHMVVLMAAVFVAVLLVYPFVSFLRDETLATVVVIATLSAVIMVAKSPAVTIAMLTDYRASGPLSQRTLVITVLLDLVLIVLFAIVVTVCKGMLDESAKISASFLLLVGIQLLGSLVVGILFAGAMHFYVRAIGSHLIIFLVGTCLLMALVAEHPFSIPGIGDGSVHLEPLLIALAAGLFMKNAWPGQCRLLFQTLEIISLPVYCLFFALAAAKVDLTSFSSLWYLSVGLVIVFLISTWAGVTLGIRAARITGDWTRYLWFGLLPQAGVSLVLVTLVTQTFPDANWSLPLREVLIATVFLNQVLGPILFRFGLLASGEGRLPGSD